jgi:hypothetical protein
MKTKRDPNHITFKKAAGLYLKITGAKLTPERLTGLIYKSFPHLGVFAPRARDECGPSFLLVAVNRKRFEYFVRTRCQMLGTAKPGAVFSTAEVPYV